MPFEQQLLKLYSEQLNIATDDYLEAHSHNIAGIRRHTDIFERYSRFVPEVGAVLDWGCNHAPDPCLVRMLRGDPVRLYGCDVHAKDFKAFFDFAKLSYTALTHPYQLPYDNSFFDAVIGCGALEHTPNDSECLKEIYRILKPGGVFIMTTLPNRLSYTEWLNRTLNKPHHLRIYSSEEAKNMFLHHGIFLVASGYHQVFPSLCGTKGRIFSSRIANKLVDFMAAHNTIAETTWPIRCFSSSVFIIGAKVASFQNVDFDLGRRTIGTE